MTGYIIGSIKKHFFSTERTAEKLSGHTGNTAGTIKNRIAIWPNSKRYALSVRRKFMFTANGPVNRPLVQPATRQSLFQPSKTIISILFRALPLVRHAVQRRSCRQKYLTAAGVLVQSAAVHFCTCRISLSNAQTNFRRIKTAMPALPVPTADGTMY